MIAWHACCASSSYCCLAADRSSIEPGIEAYSFSDWQYDCQGFLTAFMVSEINLVLTFISLQNIFCLLNEADLCTLQATTRIRLSLPYFILCLAAQEPKHVPSATSVICKI